MKSYDDALSEPAPPPHRIPGIVDFLLSTTSLDIPQTCLLPVMNMASPRGGRIMGDCLKYGLNSRHLS